MHSTTLRRAVTAAAAVTALALTSAACSDGGGDDGGSGGGKGKSSGGSGGSDGVESGGKEDGGSGGGDDNGGSGSTGGTDGGGNGGAGTPPLTKAQLEKALLKTGDVKGYKAQRNTKDALPAQNTMESDKSECEAITDAVDSKPKYARTAYTAGVLMKGDFNTGSVIQQVLLAAYEKGDAAKWLGELERALDGCRQFQGKAGTGEEAQLEIEPGKQIGVGDDSVQFTMKDAKGKDSPTVFTIVRAGNNTATFMSIGVSGDPVPIGKPVVVKQHEKLTAAGGS
ncbi:hypothetical protein DVA86_31530 [Streptomyces armeniacus]|uniref:Lipoprotein n=1 Tax=Streptomyces armeniacus TaxID=83291 RepID=A0A345XXS4_9ACTN|nr:hypothetical protein [Streptomyces armeniacus]AXK36440.1 hypothetical protein DVA86_31530 [Streptomyces armeniacus]